MLAPVAAAFYNPQVVPMTTPAWFGLGLALCGFALEAVADQQKWNFKSAGGKGVIMDGVYRYVQYPNYTGEIVFWTGLSSVAYGSIPSGPWRSLAFVAPVFIAFLLTKFSGIPLTEKSRRKRLADDEKYQKYRKSTSLLIPGLY